MLKALFNDRCGLFRLGDGFFWADITCVYGSLESHVWDSLLSHVECSMTCVYLYVCIYMCISMRHIILPYVVLLFYRHVYTALWSHMFETLLWVALSALLHVYIHMRISICFMICVYLYVCIYMCISIWHVIPTYVVLLYRHVYTDLWSHMFATLFWVTLSALSYVYTFFLTGTAALYRVCSTGLR